ncbi:hypothetical protein DM860_016464 [Cuscuta australis]|uniref:Uncharacterized protein n=1 Tax=Cuscuta australis TaxID=267555 RepID=A0A328DHW2_9ASTE|nr:hypothetical protein DM860_016464 [Cuscuta australis]
MELRSPCIATKLLAAANTQREHFGARANYLIVLVLQLLQAATRVRAKHTPIATLVDVFKEFKAQLKAELNDLASKKLLDVRNKKDVYNLLLSSVAAKLFKQFFYESYHGRMYCYSRWVVVELCGATTIFLDMCECGLLNVVQVYGLMCKDSRVMAGAGASDFVLYKELREFAWRAQSDHREALLKFSDSLLVVPAILAENNGFDVTSTIKKWHDDDNMMRMGINISTGAHSSIRIWDLYTSRESAVTSALDFVLSWLESMAAKELKSYIYGGL